jgi:hypothetical protein
MKRGHYTVQNPSARAANYPEQVGNPQFMTPAEKYAQRERERQEREHRNRT